MHKPTASYDLMALSLQRIFTDAAVESLFGSGPQRALAAYRSLTAEGTCPSAYLEFPLHGPASYDVFVGPYSNELHASSRLPEANPPACHAAWDWAATLAEDLSYDLLFELDAAGPKDQHAGIHFRHMGDVDAAAAFYRAIGEGWRAPLYRSLAERLPKGWQPVYAALFAGRPGVPTRLELFISDEVRLRIVRDDTYLGSCLDQLGFRAHNSQMLEEIKMLVALGRPVSLQFDILEDGFLGGTVSVASFFEGMGPDFRSLFLDGGIIANICSAYERMGISDSRWRLTEQVFFADKRVMDIGGKKRWVSSIATPICGKAKWADTVPMPARFYLALRNEVGEPWSLAGWIAKQRPSTPSEHGA